MMNIRPFQIILLGIFGGFALLGVIFFALFENSSSQAVKGYGESVEVWGTLPVGAVNDVFFEIAKTDKDFQVVFYVEKDERTFDLELLNAIAEGRSPDLVILPSDGIVKNREKLFPISYDSYPERDFRDTYVDGAEVYLLDDGIYGIPFAVDPLVMYWNRDLFSSSGLATPPRTWEELVGTTVPLVTRKNSSFEVEQSTVAFGEYVNVTHAKDILSLLFLQSGTSIVEHDEDGYVITLKETNRSSLPPADAALSFYTQFSLPTSPQYSWNRSLPDDINQFSAGKLGLYFGFGSEYQAVRNSNPNLNFDITVVPQGTGATVKRGYGTFYALAIPRASLNAEGAYKAAVLIGSENVSASLSDLLDLAPVHRAELGRGVGDPYRQVLYTAALTARGWLDPDPVATEQIFKTMIEDVISGRSAVSESVADALDRLELLFIR